MSTSNLFILNGKSTTHLKSFQNGYGSGPAVWDYVNDHYLTPDEPALGNTKRHEVIWSKIRDESVPECIRVVMVFTFDRAYAPFEHLDFLADQCIKFGQEYPTPERVNHWVEIGEYLKTLVGVKQNRHARGVCLQCTSVTDAWEWSDPDEYANVWAMFKCE